MKKTVIAALAAVFAAVFSLLYFEFPMNLIRPVFHTDAINRYAGEFGLDPLLVTAVIKVESNFARRARSHRGAVGLMQILPSTASELAPELGYSDVTPAELEDPAMNVRFGSFYIKKLISEFNGNVFLALAAYNAGKAKVQSWYIQNPMIGIEPDDIPYRETRNYVKSVTRTYQWLKSMRTLTERIIPGRNRGERTH